MCGIYACFSKCETDDNVIVHHHDNIAPRGPDEMVEIDVSDSEVKGKMVFYRLAIMDVKEGHQPFPSECGEIFAMCNGEIYNHHELVGEHGLPVKTHSDCEVILHLYQKYGVEKMATLLDGEFAFIIYDRRKHYLYYGRDIFGVKPLYYHNCHDGTFELSSTIRGLSEHYCQTKNEVQATDQVRPRTVHLYDLKNNNEKSANFYKFPDVSYDTYRKCGEYESIEAMREYDRKEEELGKSQIYSNLVTAVKKRVEQSEREVGFFLSGGLDSSIILSIALKECKFERPPKAFTFAFNTNAPDYKAAEKVVKWLRERYGEYCIDWKPVVMDITAGINAVPEVIKQFETYDTTTIRAGTPMYLLSRHIADTTDVKVLLTGEGSDELFGGYLYFNYSPDEEDSEREVRKLLSSLHYFDVLRADRATASNGLEIRPPFLDKTFVNSVLKFPKFDNEFAKWRKDKDVKWPVKRTTKTVLRSICRENDMLPIDIIEGRKEAFSDAVGLSWQDELEKYAGIFVRRVLSNFKTDDDDTLCLKLMKTAVNTHAVHLVEKDVEDMKNVDIFIQQIFHQYVANGNDNCGSRNLWHLLPYFWTPNQDWVDTGGESSARALDLY